MCSPHHLSLLMLSLVPELISSEFSEASSFIQTWSLNSWEFIKPVLQKTLSYQPLSIKDNTDLEFVWKLQAFKKASSLKDHWIHALLRSRQIAQLQLRQWMGGGGTLPPHLQIVSDIKNTTFLLSVYEPCSLTFLQARVNII